MYVCISDESEPTLGEPSQAELFAFNSSLQWCSLTIAPPIFGSDYSKYKV